MKNKSIALKMFITTASLIAGTAIGIVFFTGQTPSPLPFNGTFNYNSIKEFVLPLCAGTVAQTTIVFFAGMTHYPLLLTVPLFFFRGAAAGAAIRFITSAPSSVIPYIIITLELLFFSSLSYNYSHEAKGKWKRSLPVFSYSYMMICGSSILVSALPRLIAADI